MFKSIFSKYITTFMLIMIASFTMLSAVISTMMIKYHEESIDEELNSTSKNIQTFICKQMEETEEKSLKEYIKNNSEIITAYFRALTNFSKDMTVLIADENGEVLVVQEDKDGDYLDITVPSIIMEKIKDGIYTGTGSISNKKMNIVGLPIENGGAVLVGTTADTVKTLMKTTIRAVITMCLWVMLATLIAVYFISARVISPLKQMGYAAKSFASGKFDVRVPVKGHDEISELAAAFNNMASSLADLENMRSMFLSNVSHDLRTPMTVISGFIDGLLDGTIPKDKHEYYLRMIGDEVRRLSRLVAALLDVSRIQAGDRKFVMEPFDICEMARVILLSFEQKIDKKGLNVEFETDEENMYVSADRDAIYQILYNICDNGVKFSKDGGKYRIKIIERNRKVFVSVYNEGQGIKPDELAHVFERFYKGDKSRSLDKTGTGLGLYIAKSIIDAHNEEIWVKSKYEEYCEFVFTLKAASDGQIKKIFSKSQERKLGDT